MCIALVNRRYCLMVVRWPFSVPSALAVACLRAARDCSERYSFSGTDRRCDIVKGVEAWYCTFYGKLIGDLLGM